MRPCGVTCISWWPMLPRCAGRAVILPYGRWWTVQCSSGTPRRRLDMWTVRGQSVNPHSSLVHCSWAMRGTRGPSTTPSTGGHLQPSWWADSNCLHEPSLHRLLIYGGPTGLVSRTRDTHRLGLRRPPLPRQLPSCIPASSPPLLPDRQPRQWLWLLLPLP